ncbi:MAG TPA: DUF6064 family protein [Chitinophagaceae bacterium]|nr:DUF6064 family protein [Chitinophagaceae bacterium]
MKLPFTLEEFLKVFREYNQWAWPLQILFNLLGLVALLLTLRQEKIRGRIISLILAFLWYWMGLVYHIFYFSPINPAAYGFGAAFILQGFLFLYAGVFKSQLQFQLTKSISSLAGIVFLIYALLLYPVLSFLNGHPYPESPTFGLPCPTTIFTFGILLFVTGKIPVLLTIIPFAWALIGTTAAFSLGFWEDLGLLAAALVVGLFLSMRKKSGEGQPGQLA